jgi:hypothetical protein
MESLKSKIALVNQRLRSLLANARLALQGERDFGVEMVRALASQIREMDSVMSDAKHLRAAHPEISEDLDLYISLATELKTVLEHIRVMLLSRRASLENDRAHMEAVSRWAAAFQSTR